MADRTMMNGSMTRQQFVVVEVLFFNGELSLVWLVLACVCVCVCASSSRSGWASIIINATITRDDPTCKLVRGEKRDSFSLSFISSLLFLSLVAGVQNWRITPTFPSPWNLTGGCYCCCESWSISETWKKRKMGWMCVCVCVAGFVWPLMMIILLLDWTDPICQWPMMVISMRLFCVTGQYLVNHNKTLFFIFWF